MAKQSPEQKTFIAPDNYRKLCEPFPSAEAAEDALNAFWEELYELRNKHRIPDLTVVARANFASDDDDEASVMVDVHCGDRLQKEPMLAWAFGRAQADRQAEIGRLMNGSIKAWTNRK